MALIVKYKFQNVDANGNSITLLPKFPSGVSYTKTDVVEGNITTRVIETDDLSKVTYIRFGCEETTYVAGAWEYLTEIIDINISYVNTFYQMFRGCKSLTSLDVSNWDISKVTNMSLMFTLCSQLTQLDVSDWDTSNVTNMSEMFYDCQSLISLDVSNWDTSKVTTMNSMFRNCSQLTQLDVSKWDTSKVTNTVLMFFSCTSLTSLDVSNWDTSKVTTMNSMFRNCSQLTQLDVSKWDTSNVTNMYYMFRNCSSLKSLDTSNWDTSNVTTMNNMFCNCTTLTSLDVSNWDTSKVTDTVLMFLSCTSLTSLDLSNWDTSKVTTMSEMFRNCTSLTSLDVSNWDTSNTTIMSYTFRSCTSLTSLDVSNWDTSKVTDMQDMFYSCSNLTTLDVSGWDTSEVANMNNMFYGCKVKNVGLIYCLKETVDKLANCITSPCDFYVTNKTYTSPNPLVKYIMYREDKKPLLYYNDETQTWEKPILRRWDSIEKHSDGKYYYHKRSGEVVLNGSEGWKLASSQPSDTNFINIYVNGLPVLLSGELVCDRFMNNNMNNGESIDISTNANNIHIIVQKSKLSTQDVAGFKAWLQTNPTTVVYQHAEEKVYECRDLDLIAYNGETRLLVESGALNPKANLKVSKGVGNTIAILQNKVNVLENDINSEIDDINNEIDDINNEIDGINNEIDGINNEIDGINNEIDGINAEIDDINAEIDDINAEIDDINTDLIGVSENIEGSFISVDSKDGYLKDIEILGNTVQDVNDLADIRSVGDKLENQELYEIPVLSTNKNLFSCDFYDYSLYSQLDSTYVLKEIKLPVGIITISIKKIKEQTSDMGNLVMQFWDNTTYSTSTRKSIINSGWGVSSKNTTTIEEGKKYYIAISIGSNTLSKETILEKVKDMYEIQIEVGNTATPYEEPKQHKLTILSPTPLEKVGDVADRVVYNKELQTWGVEKNISTLILDSSEDWKMSYGGLTAETRPNTRQFYCDVLDTLARKSTDSICNKLPNVQVYSIDAEGLYIVGMDVNKLRVGHSSKSLDEFKKWLKQDDVYVKYQLAQPQFIPLPYDQQVKLRTFANKTNIHFECEIEPTLKASVPKSIGATVSSQSEQIDNLGKELEKINNLEESIVSTVTSESDFTTVENTNNGYFDDVKLEGKTLVNLNDIPFGFVVNDRGEICHIPNQGKYLHNIKPNTLYTFIVYGMNSKFDNRYTITDVMEDKLKMINGVGIFRSKSVIDYSKTRVPHIYGTGLTDEDVVNLKLAILEGDHTQNPPEFFEGLKSVGQDVDEISIESTTKNLFNGDLEIGSFTTNSESIGKTYKEVMMDSTTRVRFKNIFKVKGQCTISAFSRIGKTVQIGVQEFKDDKVIKLGVEWYDSFTTTNDFVARIKYLDDSTIDINDIIVQIKEGDTKPEFYEYKQDKKRILYYNDETQTWEKPILREWDSIEKHSDGKYYYHKRSGEVVLNGSEDWKLYNSDNGINTKAFNITLNEKISSPTNESLLISDKFINATADFSYLNDVECICEALKYIRIRINTSKLSTQDLVGFKTWLQANNVTVVYQLEEEKVYECTNLDLITYADETNLLVKSGVLNPKVTLKVKKGIGNVVTMLQNKVAMLENVFIQGLKQVLAGDMQSLAYMLYPEDFENIEQPIDETSLNEQQNDPTDE